MNYPLIQEINYLEPLEVFSLFAQDPGAILFDSANINDDKSQFSFIALDPFLTLSSKNGRTQLGTLSVFENPFLVLKKYLHEFPLQINPDLPPFQGGIAGYFAYDLCHHLEKLPKHKIDDLNFADMYLGFYDLVIAFDHQNKLAWIFSSGYPEKNNNARKNRAENRCQTLYKRIIQRQHSKHPSDQKLPANCKISSNFTCENYQTMVQRVIDYIHAGDIFQANVSQRFSSLVSQEFSSFTLYNNLRKINPASFSAYLNFNDTVLISASPERFLKLSNGMIETCPIKGTRPRGNTPEKDQDLKNELSHSTKDQAENIMIVDLMRNDLSRVCCDHSVEVIQLCKLQSYATVHHLVSTIRGTLKPDVDAVDVLCATFPGGSITGAPKIRAMEIIAELEPTSRGPYCGSIGYIGFDGSMDLSITIRTYAIKNNYITFQTGGGIVADSKPEEEYQEMLTKASALIRALQT